MKKKIIIYCVFAVILIISIPNISAVNDRYSTENLPEDIEQNDPQSASIWDILGIYIDMMYHIRIARVDLWKIISEFPGIGGTILTLINFRAFLLQTRAEVSKDLLAEIIQVLQELMP